MNLKKIIRFMRVNYFISIFLACIIFVGIVSVYKLFFTKPTFVYVKVKMGQGLWWANTAKPSIWFVNNLKKGEIEQSLTGEPVAEILSVRYYPWWASGQYDVYLDMKLKVSGNEKTGKYNFKRSTIGVGAPIDLEFPQAQFSGTIINLNSTPFKDDLVQRNVYLTKRNAYPWEYEAITVGDYFFDGENRIIEILEKKAVDTIGLISDNFGNYTAEQTENKKYITVKAKITGKKVNNQFVIGEDQVVMLGKTLNISTANFTFQDYIVSKIE